MLQLLTPHHCLPSLAVLHFLFQVSLLPVVNRVVNLLPQHQALHVGLDPPGKSVVIRTSLAPGRRGAEREKEKKRRAYDGRTKLDKEISTMQVLAT